MRVTLLIYRLKNILVVEKPVGCSNATNFSRASSDCAKAVSEQHSRKESGC